MPEITMANFTTEAVTVAAESAHSNETQQKLTDEFIRSLQKAEFYWLIIACLSAIAWMAYICYYNSRVFGFFLTMILNRIYKKAHIKIGSFSFSILSGKIMYRDVHYVTEDYALRIVDGWAIFRWWRPYYEKEIGEDLSHSSTRLSLFLEGFECHVYNRSAEYSRLEKLFDLDKGTLTPPGVKEEVEEPKSDEESTNWLNWRGLIPVVKFHVSVGRFVFGNHLVPSTLSISFDDAHFVYTTKPASTPFDQFMHVTKCNAENVRIMLVPSPKYNGPKDEPPRFMGEGFVVLHSNDVDIYYYHDEPGRVPYEPEVLHMASGDVVVRQTYPCWGMDIKCGKSTDVKFGKETSISYGPWADRQREQLWKFFYPADFQPLEVTKTLEPGQKRQFRCFDFRMNILADASVDILFTKNTETQAIHINCGPASCIESTFPYVTESNGYTSRFNGQLLHMDATTSLQFREFIEAETLEFDINVHYPLEWNSPQEWRVDLTGCKASLQLIYQHKVFIQYMIDDWSSKSVPDIYSFVPYTWTLNLILKEFELVTLTNEFNWIDCSSANQENAHIAAGGDILDLSLIIPYTDYLPPTVPLKLFIRAENVDIRIHLPETNTTSQFILALSENMKIMDRDGQVMEGPFGSDRDNLYRKVTQKSHGWIDCMQTPIIAINLVYTYHPCPVQQRYGEEDFNLTTPELEDKLLVPLLPLKPTRRLSCVQSDNFDPTTLAPDVFELELEVGPTVVCVYGTLLRNFLHLKENYFGEDQKFNDFEDSPSATSKSLLNKTLLSNQNSIMEKPFDPRDYRPMALSLTISVYDIQAHLIRHCGPDDPPCPSVFVEHVGFEMDKKYRETKLQVLLSPAVLITKDNVERNESDDGHLALSSLQVRGHAMFSDVDRPLDEETLEYAWLIEATIGNLTGKLTAPQLHQVVESLQAFVFQVEDTENELQHPLPFKVCQHNRSQSECTTVSNYPFPCPTTEEIKYRLTRLSVDLIDLYVVEKGSAVNLQVYPIRVATCNLHGNNNKAGVTGLINQIQIRQFIQSCLSNDRETDNPWVEAGGISLGPLNVDAAIALPMPEYQEIQEAFLKKHDNVTRRLWFLWPMDVLLINSGVADKCGCLGGCTFFGTNKNGINFFNLQKSNVSANLELNPEGVDLGYGQSLLHINEMIFDYQSSAMPPSISRVQSSRISTPGTPMTNTTLVDDLPLPGPHTSKEETVLVMEDFNTDSGPLRSDMTLTRNKVLKMEAGFAASDDFGSEQTLKAQQVKGGLGNVDSLNGDTTDNQEDFMPDDSMPDAYDTDRYASSQSGGESSEPRSGSPQLETSDKPTSPVKPASDISRHSRSMSDGVHKITRQTSMPTPGAAPVSPLIGIRKPMSHAGSKSSLVRSPVLYRHPSLVSQNSRRSFRPLLSADSLTGSEMYYSADEEMSESEYGSFSNLSMFDRSIDYSMDMKTPTQELEDSQTDTNSPTGTPPATVIPAMAEEATDSPSDANSSCSYMSANSDLEQIAMIDLHGQFNQPITKSPLLMSCYLNHLTHSKCSNWSALPPAPYLSPGLVKRASVTSPLPALSSYVPHFETTRQGFSTSLMTHRLTWKQKIDAASNDNNATTTDANSESPEPETAFTLEDKTSKTTAVIKLTGSVDVLVSPLSLESATRYVQALTPSLSKIHPSAVLDVLHICCSDIVQSQNRLKKAAERDEATVSTPNEGTKFQADKDKWKTSRFQVLFSLKEINMCFLQASIVEETISFSALASPRDLTCVSVLAICFENLSCQYLVNNQSKKVLELPAKYQDETKTPSPKKKPSVLMTGKFTGGKTKEKTIQRGISAEYDEDTELHTEEVIGNLHIGRLHCQLQRLQKHGSIGHDVILTAIPDNQSKVLFSFQQEPCEDYFMYPVLSSKSRASTRNSHFNPDNERSSPPPKRSGYKANLIMFEMGLEELDFKVAKRSGFQEMAEHLQKLEEHQKEMEETFATYEILDEESLSTPLKPSPPKPKFCRETSKSISSEKASCQSSHRSSVGADSNGSWPSRISYHISEDETPTPAPKPVSKLEGNASNAVMDFNTVWFNFAAPPAPKGKKKVDFTRMDWNLLSTATPAINAWLNPADRLSQGITRLSQGMNRRRCAVMACMMTDALDMQSIHMPPKRKYNKITLLSKTLQEDPSCQLFTVMRRYVQHVGVVTVETYVSSDTVPQNLTVQKGILAAVRQWKNQLYMPILAEAGFLTKNFNMPNIVSYEIARDVETESVDNLDVVNEEEDASEEGEERPLQETIVETLTSPLKTVTKSLSNMSLAESLRGAIPLTSLRGGMSPDQRRPSFSPSQTPLQATMAKELGSATKLHYKSADPVIRHQSDDELKTVDESEIDANFASPVETPARGVSKILAELDEKRDEGEDLYRWMARQQEYREEPFRKFSSQVPNPPRLSTMISELTQDNVSRDVDYQTIATYAPVLPDAHILFKPMLNQLRIHPDGINPSSLIQKLGGNVSVKGILHTLKIEIVNSAEKSLKGKGRAKTVKKKIAAYLERKKEVPAFLCENFSVSLAIKDIVEFDKDKLSHSLDRRHSKRDRRLADMLERKPLTTQIYFAIDCSAITQYVNMPLLRLVNQMVRVVQNISNTNEILKQARPSHSEEFRTHRKQDSSSSTDTHSFKHMDLAHGQPMTPDVEACKTDFSLASPSGRKNTEPKRFSSDILKRPSRLLVSHRQRKTKSGDLSPTADFTNLSDMKESPTPTSPAINQKTIVDEIRETTPKCWRTLYYLLELYPRQTEPKMVTRYASVSRLPVISEEPESRGGMQDPGTPKAAEEGSVRHSASIRGRSIYGGKSVMRGTFTQNIYIGESTPMVIFGTAKIKLTRIIASLSGLTLESDVKNIYASTSLKERSKGVAKRKSRELSVTAHMDHSMIKLLEAAARNKTQTVVTMKIDKSEAILSNLRKKRKQVRELNSLLVRVGTVDIDIPQHPIVLHGMVTRSTKRLSSTIQEFMRINVPVPLGVRSSESLGDLATSAHSSKTTNNTAKEDVTSDGTQVAPLVVRIKAIIQGVSVGASLLPSLKALYQIGEVTASGITGDQAKFTVDLPTHSLSFNSKITDQDLPNVPSSASIDLPPIHVCADFLNLTSKNAEIDALAEGLTLREGSFLNATAEVGAFEHTLTTDLLNHLVFAQKVFMKEINEVLQKMSGGEKPVPLWNDDGSTAASASGPKPLLFQFMFRLKCIQITATTPTFSAVRLETGTIDFELSNRVRSKGVPDKPRHNEAEGTPHKMFAKAQVDLNVSLGQLIKNPMFEEAEPEFHTLSFFKTRISIRNALPDEIITGQSDEQEALLITLQKPVILVQPVSFDKAVMVWLNYKNAYDYWSEQRMALNKEVKSATQQVYDHFLAPPSPPPEAVPTQLGLLFLQFTVDDLGICMPLTGGGVVSAAKQFTIDEPGAVLCLTLDNTLISACSCGSMVSKGKFTGFCLRFADEFEMGWDDWRPSPDMDVIMNACVVPQGTYEVCSKTIAKTASDPLSNAKWVLNILWEMDGIDVHLDTNIGQRLSILGDTLTALAGDEEVVNEETEDLYSKDEVDANTIVSSQNAPESLPSYVYDSTIDPKLRARLIEREMNEQARLVQDLKSLGAKNAYIDLEERKLQELESVLYHDFRRDILSKIRAQSVKATALKDKLGLGYKPSLTSGHLRAKSATTGINIRKHALSSVETQGGSHLLDVSLPARPVSDMSDCAFESPGGNSTNDLLSTSLDRPHKLRRSFSQTPPCSQARELQKNNMSACDVQTGSDSGGELDIEHEYLTQASKRMSTVTEQNLPSVKTTNPTPEPIIDLEMEVKVKISSGQIVLHPKEKEGKEDETVSLQSGNITKKLGLKKEKSAAAEFTASPYLPRKLRKQESGGTKFYKQQGSSGPPDNVTIFYSPGVDVKVQYSSKTSPLIESPSSSLGRNVDPLMDTDLNASSGTKRTIDKKANLYTWISLEKLPEEMQISPALLDYLEQAMDPIIHAASSDTKSLTKPVELIDSMLDQTASSLQAGGSTYYSFPVDIVVYVRVQPSIIRFNCLPVSRVECLLRLPSLDLVFSTKRAEVDKTCEGTPPMSTKFTKHISTTNIRERTPSGTRPRTASNTRARSGNTNIEMSSGGLSVTGCLADFSLFVFHPYGGANLKKMASGSTLPKFQSGTLPNMQPGADASGGMFQESARKDSLSLNVEFVKVNISRTRRSVNIVDNVGQSMSKSTLQESTKAANTVRFSAVCDIGSATFKYDMRRLTEILALPKAWYRSTLARRLFLGDDSYYGPDESTIYGLGMDRSKMPDTKSFITSETKSKTLPHSGASSREGKMHHRRLSSGDKSKIKLNLDLQKTPSRKQSGGTSPLIHSPSKPKSSRNTRNNTPTRSSMSGIPDFLLATPPGVPESSSTPVMAAKLGTAWETLVLFAVNLSKLDVHVNMGNVMGNTMWATKDIKSQGRLSIDSAGHKNMKLSAGVGSSVLEARGGIVGGNIEVQQLHTFMKVNEDPNHVPEHTAGVKLYALEARLDYMGSSILMSRVSSLTISLSDEWQIDSNKNLDSPLATRRPALVFVHGELDWDQLHMMISRSTTPDLIKMAAKLEEYFTQQVISSKRIFSLGPVLSNIKSSETQDTGPSVMHHRHWQKVLANVSGCHLPMLPSPLPEHGSILGGTMNLHGNNISLACFHGINFRSKFWALFVMKEPNISFATEAQSIESVELGLTETHVVQNLQFNLGHNVTHLDKKHKATILKLSRGYHMPPPFNSVQEWFQYAFACSEAAGMNFPEMHPASESGPEQKKNLRKYQDHQHETEIIFALPSLQLHLQTEHRQGEVPPPPDGPMPIVEVSFVTEFEDHIFVAMDAEVILFLHDVVMAYVKEKDKGVRTASYYSTRAKSPESSSSLTDKKKLTDPTSELKRDSREFECKTWYLEPTVRLISWAGNRIDPVGVDYILQKLGFTRARVTIPKWMQRGCLDPLDKVLAVLVDRLMLVLRQVPSDGSDCEED